MLGMCLSSDTLSTLALVLADVSTYWTPHSSAFARASSTDTCRRSSRSDLFPTSRRGILSSSAFTRKICSLWAQQPFFEWTLVSKQFNANSQYWMSNNFHILNYSEWSWCVMSMYLILKCCWLTFALKLQYFFFPCQVCFNPIQTFLPQQIHTDTPLHKYCTTRQRKTRMQSCDAG